MRRSSSSDDRYSSTDVPLSIATLMMRALEQSSSSLLQQQEQHEQQSQQSQQQQQREEQEQQQQVIRELTVPRVVDPAFLVQRRTSSLKKSFSGNTCATATSATSGTSSSSTTGLPRYAKKQISLDQQQQHETAPKQRPLDQQPSQQQFPYEVPQQQPLHYPTSTRSVWDHLRVQQQEHLQFLLEQQIQLQQQQQQQQQKPKSSLVQQHKRSRPTSLSPSHGTPYQHHHHHHHSYHHRVQKHVHFPDDINEMVMVVAYVAKTEEYTREEIRNMWWQRKEYDTIRSKAKASAHDARMIGKSMTYGLDEGYITAQFLGVTVSETDLLSLLTEQMTRRCKGLRLWCARSDSRRGLENWTSKKHWQCRTEVMEEAKKMVLELSRYYHKEQVATDEIAKQYQDYTRSSRIMARMMGEADAFAALTNKDITLSDECIITMRQRRPVDSHRSAGIA